MEKFHYLSVLRNTDVHLFYRLLANNVEASGNGLARPGRESRD